MKWNTATISDMETDLVGLEAEISRLRARQVVLVNELDRAQAHHSDGSRSMVEWVQSHLDIDIEVARRLVYASQRVARHRYLSFRLADGTATLPRIVAALKYAEAGASYHDVLDSFDRDLTGVARLTARRRRVTHRDEERTFAERYFTMQPTLDESSYRMWGQVPGVMGRTLETAICQRSDQLRHTTGDQSGSQSQRHADALVSIAHDSLNTNHTSDTDSAGSSTPHVTVFIDTNQDDPARTGAEIAYGPRVGPHTLESMLCTGRIQIVGLDNGTPVVTSHATRAIPRAVRHAVLHRDGGCTIDGCRSRYRLEPHHITPRSRGGNNSMENLTTLCWYHHHIAIHGNGYTIDPHSPPQRRRLIRHTRPTAHDPP
jgi:hypothetical protein